MAVGKATIVEPEPTGTSNISTLPNKMSAQPNRVVLETTEKQNLGGPPIPPAELSQDSINQIVLGLQQASKHNLTSLASRDIPMDTSHITGDEAIKSNYIPTPQNTSYIEDDSTFNTLVQKNIKVKREQDSLDKLYEELQIPIFVMVLFFLFQLPYFQKVLIRFAPSIFRMDGKIGLTGLISKTFLFGVAYYSLTKLTHHFSQI